MKEIRDGYKETEIGVIPEDWEVVKLSKIVSNRSEKYTPKEDEHLKYIALEHLDQETGRLLGTGISSESTSTKSVFYKNDILFGKLRPYLRKYWFSDTDGVCSTEILALQPLQNPRFAFYSIQISNFIEEVSKKAFGTKMPRTSWKDIKDYDFALPPLSEQQRIAEILSSADTHLEKLDAIIDETQLLKKAMMQQLLTRGIGHTEFKDTEIGQMPKVWEVKRLYEISKNKGEYGIGSKAVEYAKNKPRYLRITDFDEYGRLAYGDLKSIAEEEYKKYILKKDDLVFARTGNTTGKSYLYREKDGKLVFAGFLIKFSIDSAKANSEFIKYCCQTKVYWDWVKMSSTRSGQPGLNSNQYSDLKLPIPPLPEQHRIAEILSVIDDRIQLYEKEKADFSELKKGMMEELLTGKIRVNHQV